MFSSAVPIPFVSSRFFLHVVRCHSSRKLKVNRREHGPFLMVKEKKKSSENWNTDEYGRKRNEIKTHPKKRKINKYRFVFDLTRYHTLALSAVCIYRCCYLSFSPPGYTCVSRHQKERNLKWKWLNGGRIAEQIKHRPIEKKSSPRWDKTHRFVCESECVCVCGLGVLSIFGILAERHEQYCLSMHIHI